MQPPKAAARLAGPAYATHIVARHHAITADEPAESGGADSGPTPVELLLSALASCTAITVRMYASRKAWPLTGIHVSAEAAHDPAGRIIAATVHVRLEGVTDEAQHRRLLEIAAKCPVHRILAEGIKVTVAAPPQPTPEEPPPSAPRP